MNFLNKLYFFIVKNPLKSSIIVVLLLLIIIISSVLYLGKFNNSSPQSTGVAGNLKNYDQLKSTINEVLISSKDISESDKERVSKRLNILENTNTKTADAYMATQDVFLIVGGIYSEINDPRYKKIAEDIGEFARINFPNQYEKSFFAVFCSDPTCAQTPQPPEVLTIIEHIKQSGLSDDLKESVIQNMENTGYLGKDQEYIKFVSYLQDLTDLRDYSATLPAGSSLQSIEDELLAFLKKDFPEEYEEYQEEQSKPRPSFPPPAERKDPPLEQ